MSEFSKGDTVRFVGESETDQSRYKLSWGQLSGLHGEVVQPGIGGDGAVVDFGVIDDKVGYWYRDSELELVENSTQKEMERFSKDVFRNADQFCDDELSRFTTLLRRIKSGEDPTKMDEIIRDMLIHWTES